MTKLTRYIVLSLLIATLISCKKDEEKPPPVTETYEYSISPQLTNPSYLATDKAHYVLSNPDLQLDKLLLFIGGTYSSPTTYKTICTHAKNIGFHVISISYPNNVPAASLSESDDILAFDNYREEICYGNELSDAVSVNELNCINMRTINLLNYLKNKYPSQGWEQFLASETTIDWSNVVVAGHSQGAGHACYFGKKNSVNSVVMFSGPNDYSEHFSAPASWLTEAGLTSLEKQFVLLHNEDEVVPYAHQLENIRGIGMLEPDEETVLVDTMSHPYGNLNAFHLAIPVISKHSSPIGNNKLLPDLWTYLLKGE